MKEKILALLTTKFSGVRKDGLARLAGALALQAADETEAGALVEKLTTEKVNEFITDYRKDVDKEVSDGVKTNEKTLKEKYDFVDKKKEPDPNPNPNPNPNPTDLTAIVANAVKAAVEPLQQKLSAIEGDKTKSSRLQLIEGKLKGVPEAFKAKALKDFNRMSFESDDAFNEYVKEVETDVTTLTQELADKGLSGHSKPVFGSADKSDEDNFVQSMKEINQEEKK